MPQERKTAQKSGDYHMESPDELIIPSFSCTTMSFPSEPLPASTKYRISPQALSLPLSVRVFSTLPLNTKVAEPPPSRLYA